MREVVDRAFGGKLGDRELTPHDYARLANAVMRLRAALRGSRRTGDSGTDDAASADAVRAALDDITAVTGVRPSDLGALVASADNVAAPPTGP